MKEEIIIDTSVKNAKQTEQELAGVADATNDANEASEEYGKTLEDNAKELEFFGVSINGLSQGFRSSVTAIKTSVTSLKSFKVALAATGIGLIVIALTSLVAWVKNTQEGMDFLNDTLAVIGEVIGTLIGVLTKLGGALIKLFKGDLRGAIGDVRSAFTGLNDQIRENIRLRLELERLIRDADKFDRDNLVRVARLQKEIQDELLTTRDIEGTSASQRLKAINIAIKKQKEINSVRQTTATVAAVIAQRQFDAAVAKGTLDDDIERARNQAAADSFKVQAANIASIRALENRANTERRTIQRERLEGQVIIQSFQEETAKAEVEQIGLIKETDLDALGVRMAATQDFHQQKLDNLQEEFDVNRDNAERLVQLQADMLGALANLAGQDTVLGRGLAIAQAGFNTRVGITQALTAPTLPQRIAGIVFATATGLAAVRDILSEPIPKVSISNSTPFGDGGMIGGNLHARGGTWINAERGEGIINRRSMSIPWVKRQASYLNTLGGGIPFMQDGGVVPAGLGTSRFINLERALGRGRTVLITSDLHAVEQRDAVVEVASTL